MTNDRTDRYFAPNGIVTYEDCPVCEAPDMKVEHGKGGRGFLQHFEHCTECGDSMPLVCYDCQACEIILEADMRHGDNWILYSADTPGPDVREGAAAKLGVPEEQVEVKWTGGGWLARERIALEPKEETE